MINLTSFLLPLLSQIKCFERKFQRNHAKVDSNNHHRTAQCVR